MSLEHRDTTIDRILPNSSAVYKMIYAPQRSEFNSRHPRLVQYLKTNKIIYHMNILKNESDMNVSTDEAKSNSYHA